MMDGRPFSQAAENNKRPIEAVLKQYLQNIRLVLEIGSGTGQHICHFAEKFPEVHWQPSDVKENVDLHEIGVQPNLLQAFILDVKHEAHWPKDKYDMVYTANTAHIMSWPEVLFMIELVRSVLKPEGLFICYGPFKFNGQCTSDSNQKFDAFLKQKDIKMGLRDFEDMKAEALKKQLHLVKVHDMPVNNHILVFQRA